MTNAGMNQICVYMGYTKTFFIFFQVERFHHNVCFIYLPYFRPLISLVDKYRVTMRRVQFSRYPRSPGLSAPALLVSFSLVQQLMFERLAPLVSDVATIFFVGTMSHF